MPFGGLDSPQLPTSKKIKNSPTRSNLLQPRADHCNHSDVSDRGYAVRLLWSNDLQSSTCTLVADLPKRFGSGVFNETKNAMNNITPTCIACGESISRGDGLWYRPAAEDQQGSRLSEDLRKRLSESDNGGVPFHRTCLQDRARADA